MKRNKIKLLIAPIAIAGLSLSGIIGGTLAYFTSADTQTVHIEAGQVRIGFAIASIELSSFGVAQTRTDYETIGNEQVEVQYFENGGYAYFAGSDLYLSKITPGDKVKIQLELHNESNVKIAYHVGASFQNEKTGLENGLVPNAGDELTGTLPLSSGVVSSFDAADEYTALEAGAEAEGLEYELELPAEAGNEYQGATSQFVLQVDAIQWNAYLLDNNIASRDSEYYPTLQDAIDDVPTDEEVHVVQIRKDVDLEINEMVQITGGRKVVLDLGENDVSFDTSGRPSGGLYPGIYVAADSELEIVSDGTVHVESDTGNKPLFYNQGKITVTGGDYQANNATVFFNQAGGEMVVDDITINKSASIESSFFAIRNLGDLTIRGGEFTSDTQNANGAIVENRANCVIEGGRFEHTNETSNENLISNFRNGATMEIHGGTFITNSPSGKGISNGQSSTLVIDGDDTYIESMQSDAVDSFGTLVINGGTIKVNTTTSSPAVYAINRHSGTVTINGGTFLIGDISDLDTSEESRWTIGTVVDNASVTINGGTFNAGVRGNDYGDLIDKGLADYENATINGDIVENQDGTWSVVAGE